MGDSRSIRTKFSLALLTSGILAMVILPGVANGMSPNTFCGDQEGLETISTGEFVNIIVPSPNDDDGRCMLTGDVLVTGNVKVNPGGELEVTDGVEIEGNLQAKGAAEIYVGTVVGPIIHGNVQIRGSTDDVTIEGSSIGGDIKIRDQSAGIILIDGNDVSGSIKLRDNTAEVILVENNDVDGDIKLEDNEGTSTSPGIPINVRENDVDGNIELHNNLVSGTGSRDLNILSNDVEGNVVLDGNESTTDDFKFLFNDVGGDVTVINNKADDRVTIRETCMTGNGNIDVKDNVSDGRTEVEDNGGNTAGVDFACSDGERPTNITVTGNTAGTDLEVEDNEVDNDLLCSDNDPDPTTSGNTVGGTFDCSD